MTELRDYQQEMLTRLNKAWERHRSVMVQMPTGTGKTHLMAAVIREHISEGVLIVAHRRELLDQIRATVRAFGIDLEKEAIVVESIQKLSRAGAHGDGAHRGQTLCSPVAGAPYPQQGQSPCAPSLVIVDEAHHALAKTYKMLWGWWPKAKFLGLTATPCRLSGEAFTDLFDMLLQSWDIQTFIEKGWLSDFEYISARRDNPMVNKVCHLNKRGTDGDLQTTEMASVLDSPESIEHLYDTYKQFADGKKGIIYAINIAHAKHISKYYQEQGVNVCEIDSKTPALERQQKVEDYRNGKIDILVSVDLFGEGVDVPEVEFIQLARPTLSLSKYLQQVGRGMRVSKGKPHVTILDNVGLYLIFGLPTYNRDWKQMFWGFKAGAGRMTELRETTEIVPLDSTAHEERELINLRMERVKGSGERKSGLEIFEENGRYGIRYDGHQTCIAKFTSIELLKDSEFFAVASYSVISKVGLCQPLPYKTVIDLKGNDLHSQILDKGELEEVGQGFFKQTVGATVHYWDAKTGEMYSSLPTVVRFGYVEGLHFEKNGADCYTLRSHRRHGEGVTFMKEDVYYNKYITVIKNRLVVNTSPNDPYYIEGYRKKQIIVSKGLYSNKDYQLINLDGTFGKKMSKLSSSCVAFTHVGPMFLGKQIDKKKG